MPSISQFLLVVSLFVVTLTSILYTPVKQRLKVFGITDRGAVQNVSRIGQVVKIPDLVQCEDLHYLPSVNLLFTACEDDYDQRFKWWPPLGHLDDVPVTNQGSFHVIDPVSFETQRLKFDGFSGAFITHGIDIIEDPDDPKAFFVFAINHLPNPEYRTGNTNAPKARSQIEIFHYKLGSPEIKHVRSVRHALIATPNDIYATSPTSFYATNDHHYREGFGRHLEDMLPVAAWSSTVHVTWSESSLPGEAESGVAASIVLRGLQTNNGMGHMRDAAGKDQPEILVASAVGGVLYRTTVVDKASNNYNLSILESIQMESTIDNPSYFSDPYPTVGHDSSGYILAGIKRAIDFSGQTRDSGLEVKDPALVWHVTKSNDGQHWDKRLIFDSEGEDLRTATTAVLVPIDPDKEGGVKRGWLFVTGMFSKHMIAVKLDL